MDTDLLRNLIICSWSAGLGIMAGITASALGKGYRIRWTISLIGGLRCELIPPPSGIPRS